MPVFKKDGKFIEWSGPNVRCSMCATGFMHRNSASSHFDSNCHKNRLEEYESGCRLTDSDIPSKYAIAKLLGHSEWRNDLKARIYDYAVDKKGSPLTIRNLYRHYRKMEVTSLLELSIWKSSICGDVFLNLQEVYDCKALQVDFDPFEYIREKRITSGAEVIVPLVTPSWLHPSCLSILSVTFY